MAFMRYFAGICAILVLSWTYALFAQQLPLDREEIDSWYEWIMHYMLKPGFMAVSVGIIMAFIIPQRVKMDFPLTWSPEKRKMRTRLTSFISGFFGTAMMWPLFWPWATMSAMEVYGASIGGLVASILVGASAPYTYNIVMHQLYKRGWVDASKWSGQTVAALRLQQQPQDGNSQGIATNPGPDNQNQNHPQE
jgi:hypothetical protein